MAKKKSPPKRPAGKCMYFEAPVATDHSGDVVKGTEIGKHDAVNRRKNGDDVVVCGPDSKENRQEAADIEQKASGVGNYLRHAAHGKAGPNALNHYQAISGSPPGHTFYETKSQRAK